MKKEILATSSVIGLSFLIASCCIAPALFLLFGISVSALGALAVFEPYRPIFIAAGAGALLYAAHLIYRRVGAEPAPEDASDACAPDSAAPRQTRILLGVAAFVFVGSIVYPYVIGVFF